MSDELMLGLQMNEEAAKLLLKSVDFFIDKWPGGDPKEQEGLFQLQNRLRCCVLEYRMHK